MKIAVRMLSALVVCLCMTVLAISEEKDKPKAKETTLKGTILCTKCELGETDDCGNAIQVKVDDKDVTYYFKDNGKKEKYHAKVCGKPAKGSVIGVVSEKDKKKFITPSKDGVKFD